MVKKLSAVSIVAIIGIFLGCPRTTEITPTPPEINDQAMCKVACDHIGPEGLRCDEGLPIDMGKACLADTQCDTHQLCSAGRCIVTCERFCIDTENNGVWLDPTCVSTVKSCSEIDSCPRTIVKKCSGNECYVPERR